MAKYRLSYLENGGYKDIDLSKLECLKGRVVTDIKTIDELTLNFKSCYDFMCFLKRNKIINDTNLKLEITIDKKVKNTKNVYNKPIFNSDKLLFSYDEELLKYDFILKKIREHILDGEYMYKFALNFEEKYQNAYNRITGSSFILGLITTIKVVAIKLSNKEYLNDYDIENYKNAINNLFIIELYKYESIKKNGNTVEITRKKDEDGNYIKNYRGAHDFVNLLKYLEPDIIKIEEEEREEFLVLNEDFRRVNEKLVYSHKFEDEIYEDGIHDCIKDFEDRQDMFRELQRDSRKYCLKKGDGKI